MRTRHCLVALGLLLCAHLPPVLAADALNAPRGEGAALAARAGTWEVVETSWAQAGAAPQVVHGQIAERRMIGRYLQETLHASGAYDDAMVNRVDYLGFNRVTARWEYVSMDTRVAVGLMPAWSFEADQPQRIRVQFDPFVLPNGQLLRMEQIIEQAGPDAETKDQYFILPDGSGSKWLAHRYAYRRKKTGE